MTARPDPSDPPAAAALITATLALMTGWAALSRHDDDDSPSPGATGVADHRPCMARKIGVNLGLLAGHPGLPDGMRLVMENLQQRWSSLLRTRCPAASAGPAPGAYGEVRLAPPAVMAAAAATDRLLARLRERS
jgi:hypothetical protein